MQKKKTYKAPDLFVEWDQVGIRDNFPEKTSIPGLHHLLESRTLFDSGFGQLHTFHVSGRKETQPQWRMKGVEREITQANSG